MISSDVPAIPVAPRVLVLTATGLEHQASVAIAGESAAEQARRRIKVFCYSGCTILAAQCGIGPCRAGRSSEALIEITRPDMVLNVGTAGGNRQFRTGQAVIPCRVVNENGCSSVLPGIRLSGRAVDPETLVSRLIIPGLTKSLRAVKGEFITLSRPVFDKHHAARALRGSIYPRCFEMETYEIARAANNHGIPWISGRIISDMSGPLDHLFYRFHELRSLNAISLLTADLISVIARVARHQLDHVRNLPA